MEQTIRTATELLPERLLGPSDSFIPAMLPAVVSRVAAREVLGATSFILLHGFKTMLPEEPTESR